MNIDFTMVGNTPTFTGRDDRTGIEFVAARLDSGRLQAGTVGFQEFLPHVSSVKGSISHEYDFTPEGVWTQTSPHNITFQMEPWAPSLFSTAGLFEAQARFLAALKIYAAIITNPWASQAA